MIQTIKSKLSVFFKRDDHRSQKIIKNIFLSFGVKGGSILIGLMLVPMTISYINPVQYGIWLTISSIISWMGFFDIGLGNGLRNKLTNSLALHEYEQAKTYVSTTYASLAIISLLLFLLFFITTPFVDWRSFLNIPASVNENIQLIILIVLASFSIQFVVQLLNTVLTSIHEPAMAGFISFLGQAGILLTIVILKFSLPGSLHILVLALTIVPILVLVIASIILYRGKLKNIRPSFKYINFSYTKSILNVGGAFFFIQIGALVLFQTDNIIITKVIGPEAVTQFNVAYKLFSIITMVFSIILTPYWSAFTDAYAKHDFVWMKKNVAIMHKLWLLLSIGVVILLIASNWLFKMWLGKEVIVAYQLSIAMAIYVIIYMWQTLHVYFLNGTNNVRLQLLLVTISAIINIPLAIFLGRKWGLPGIISANTIVFVVMGILFSIQVNKILNKKAFGIWAK